MNGGLIVMMFLTGLGWN